jgi:NAD(P)-dependent dehydrogenase (short-subunit alcohol dehydrogenase family)
MTVYPFSCLPHEFKGKRVLITGGTKGVGAATIQRFQMSGASVATTARSESSESRSSVIFIRRISAPPPVYKKSSTALNGSGVESTS